MPATYRSSFGILFPLSLGPTLPQLHCCVLTPTLNLLVRRGQENSWEGICCFVWEKPLYYLSMWEECWFLMGKERDHSVHSEDGGDSKSPLDFPTPCEAWCSILGSDVSIRALALLNIQPSLKLSNWLLNTDLNLHFFLLANCMSGGLLFSSQVDSLALTHSFQLFLNFC